MAVTIEELNIELTSNTSNAADAIGELNAKLKELKSTSDAGAGLQKISEEAKRVTEDIEGMKRVTESTNKATESQKQFRDETRKPSGLDKIDKDIDPVKTKLLSLGGVWAGLKKSFIRFASSIRRIMLYRIIRALLKQVAEAFTTGINNLYQYGLKASTQFAKSMDSMATSAQYFQNSIAALAVPLYQAIIPVLDCIS